VPSAIRTIRAQLRECPSRQAHGKVFGFAVDFRRFP
jgi:hypothetical protein